MHPYKYDTLSYLLGYMYQYRQVSGISHKYDTLACYELDRREYLHTCGGGTDQEREKHRRRVIFHAHLKLVVTVHASGRPID